MKTLSLKDNKNGVLIGGQGSCIKVYNRGQLAKILLHFNTPENILLIFPQTFERDSYFTSTTL